MSTTSIISCHVCGKKFKHKNGLGDHLHTVIIPKLTGISTDRSGCKYPGRYEYGSIPRDLGKNDHAPVIEDMDFLDGVRTPFKQLQPTPFTGVCL